MVVYDLLEKTRLLGDGLDAGEYTGVHSWVKPDPVHEIIHPRNVAGLFVDRRPVDAIMFHHDLLGTDDPKSFFSIPEQAPGRRLSWQCSGA